MFEIALGAAVAAVVATVVVARWPRGSWMRRFAYAAPLGALAGLAEAAALAAAGGSFRWWLALAGVAVAAVLPLTRRQRRAVAPDVRHAPIGDYRLDGVFATTPTAVVYRARCGDDQPALLKLLPPPQAGDPAARLRLRTEAQVLANLRHDHCVKLRETLADQQGTTLVLEPVDGAPLTALVARTGSLPAPQAVTVATGVLAGLGALHTAGLVHRDVAPDNVWLTADGTAKLAGFEQACSGVEHPVAPHAGTYASPEQQAGEVLDERTDIWSCAAMLRDLWAGAQVPAPLADLVTAALATDRAARPGSAESFAAALEQAAHQAWGADWRDRTALAAALTAHGAIGAAAGGWAIAGAGAASAGAAGSGAGVAAVGAAGPDPATAAAGDAAAGTGGLGAAPGSVTGSGSSAAGVGSSAAATATAAAAAAAVVIAGAVTVPAAPAEPGPAAAATPEHTSPPPVTETSGPGVAVIDPAEAEQLVTTHLADGDTPALQRLRNDTGAIGDASAIVLGVPCDVDADAGAWFVATAEVAADDGTVQVMLRFAHEDGEWASTDLHWSIDQPIGAPLLDPRGCLAGPDPTELTVDPHTVPQIYEDLLAWEFDVTRGQSGPVPEARRIADRARTGFDRYQSALYHAGSLTSVVRSRDTASMAQTVEVGPVESVLPLANGVVVVTFPATVHMTWYNRPDQQTGPCTEHLSGDRWVHSYMRPQTSSGGWGQTTSGISETGRHEPYVPEGSGRQVDFHYSVRATAWVPTHGTTRAEVPYTLGEDDFPAVVVIKDEFDHRIDTVSC